MEDTFDPAAGIASECHATRDFIGLLQREQRALQQADVSTLVALTNEKTHRMQQLARMNDARSRWLAILGHTGDRFGMERVLSDYPAATGVWKDLLQLAEIAVEPPKSIHNRT